MGLVGFSAGGHLAGMAALAADAGPYDGLTLRVLGYAITSMETETYRPARLILLERTPLPSCAVARPSTPW